MRHRFAASTLALVAALCLAALWPVAHARGSASPSPIDKVTLRVGWTESPDGVNPFTSMTGSSQEVYSLVYDYLTRWDAATLQIRPALATSWSTSADGTMWTFKLREGVNWHDGQPFTAADVKFTFDYIIDNEMSAWLSYTTFIESVRVVDSHTVRFECSRPKANILAMPVPILPRHIWQKIDPDKAGTSRSAAPLPTVGTGAFQLTEFKQDQYARLIANQQYWRGAAHIDELIFSVYQNPDTMYQDLKTGYLHAALELPYATYKPLTSNGDFLAVAANPYRASSTLGFNCYADAASMGNPVLRDQRFRWALNFAIDKERIAQIAFDGLADPASSILPAHYYRDPDWHWEPTAQQSARFDPKEAGRLLDEAGYRDTDGDGVRDDQGLPIKLRLWVRADSPQDQTGGKLIAGWLHDIGLQIDYEVLDTGALSDRIWNYKGDTFAPDYDVFIWGWGGDIDPNFLMSVYTSDQVEAWNDAAWSNEEYDRLFDEQQSALDPAKRQALLWRMQALMYRQSPVIFTIYQDMVSAYNTKDWTGWVRSPAGNGQALGTQYVIDSYLEVRPVAHESAGSGAPGGLIVAGVVGAAAALALIVWLARRRRTRSVEVE
jgi:peptide/nickel transport system substrate-binding protein